MLKGIQARPEVASTTAGQVDAICSFWVFVSVVATALVFVLVVYLAVKYRRRHDDQIGHAVHGSNMLEIAWSVIPLGIMLFMFAWGMRVFFTLSRPPAQATEYWCVGK